MFLCLSNLTARNVELNKSEPIKPPVATVQQVKAPQPQEERPVEATPQPVAPEPVKEPAPVVELPKSKIDLMNLAGIPESDQSAVDYIVSKESSWNHLAVNRSSGATGLCQSLPASKMASAGGDYMTNPVTQLKWCHQYATSRYGSWWSAHAFWLANAWW